MTFSKKDLPPEERYVTSDCGLAWSAPPELREILERRFREAGIEAAGFHALTL